MHITALDVLAPLAKLKLWVKANGEMPLLYGGNVLKAHVGRVMQDGVEFQGVVVLGMGGGSGGSGGGSGRHGGGKNAGSMGSGADGLPLGFGVVAKSSNAITSLDPTATVVFRQADLGEYLRDVSLSLKRYIRIFFLYFEREREREREREERVALCIGYIDGDADIVYHDSRKPHFSKVAEFASGGGKT